MSASIEGEKPRDNRQEEGRLSAALLKLHRAEKAKWCGGWCDPGVCKPSGPETDLQGEQERPGGAVTYTQD